MDIQYIGENLFWGYVGRFAIFLAFFSAIFAAFSYYRATSTDRIDYRLWRSWARKAFRFHSLMIAIASLMLLYILLSRFYEYRYVWIHMENGLPLGYRLASFWAGQEGSLLFWVLAQAVFGIFLIRYSRQWEMHTMTIFSACQVFMVSMLLGIRFQGASIGMDPFLLLRLAPENVDNHFFHNPNYLSLITDGNGLNPLLRNFWMLSHPPVTFIGYAAVLVPYCFSLAGMWRGRFHDWIRPALPWTVLGVFFLGAGILLGGVWAYESLTFGGFWAWDPIENASLVPWLIIVAALHLMLVARKKRHTYFPAFLFAILAYVFVVYASYLTRSGVLSETSVHSFGRDGMGWHILIYLFTLLVAGLVLLLRNYSKLPAKESEKVFARDFWMFVASLVLVLSAFQIIFSTSVPVINKVIGSDLSPPANVVSHYNTWQLPFAVVIALLVGLTHFLRWGSNDIRRFTGLISFSVIAALVAGILLLAFYGIGGTGHIMMLFASLFALFSSLDMLLRFKRKYISVGGAVTHLGISLFLLAVLLTFSKKTTISENTSGYFLGENFSETENLLLIRDEVLPMGDYHVSYSGSSIDGDRIIYHVDFLKKNREGDLYRVFTSYPSVLLNERMGNVYEPYARVYPFRDIFTYVSFADLSERDNNEPFTLIEEMVISVGDTAHLNNNHLFFKDLEIDKGQGGNEGLRVSAVLSLETHYGEIYNISPSYIVSESSVIHEDHTIRDLDLKFRFSRPLDEPYTIYLEVYEEQPDFIIIKTVIFPLINLLWASILILLAGLWISFRKLRREARIAKTF